MNTIESLGQTRLVIFESAHERETFFRENPLWRDVCKTTSPTEAPGQIARVIAEYSDPMAARTATLAATLLDADRRRAYRRNLLKNQKSAWRAAQGI